MTLDEFNVMKYLAQNRNNEILVEKIAKEYSVSNERIDSLLKNLAEKNILI